MVQKGKRTLCVLMATLLLCSQAFPVLAVDRYLEGVKELAANDENYENSDDGMFLSWREAPAIEAYLNAYRTYGDSEWLAKSKVKIDALLSHAYDFENDGFFGWYSSFESTQHLINPGFEQDGPGERSKELLQNGSFETPDASDASLPAGWSRLNGGSAEAYRTQNPRFAGNAAAVLAYNGQTDPARLIQRIAYEPGVLYTVSYAVKTDGKTTAGKVEIYNGTTGSVIVQSPTFAAESIYIDEWVRGSFNFRAPASEGIPLFLRIGLLGDCQSAGKQVFFDELSVKPAETYENLLVNGDFEEGAASDQTLPAGWSRPSFSTAVARTNAGEKKFSGDFGVSVGSNGTSWQTLYQNVEYVPYGQYTLSFFGKSNAAGATGMADIYDVTANRYIASKLFTNRTWEEHTLTFQAPAAGHVLRVELRQSSYTNVTGNVSYDRVILKTREAVDENKIANASMETASASDATLPAGWERVGSPALVYRSAETGEKGNGDYGLVVGSDGKNVQMLKQIFSYVPGRRYLLTFRGKTSAASANLKAQIYDESAGKVVAWKPVLGKTEWGDYAVLFTAPEETGHTLSLQLSPTTAANAAWVAYFDDVRLTAYDEGLIFNSGFETLSSADNTMAAGWQRVPASAQASVSTTINEYYAGTRGMKITSSPTVPSGVETAIEYHAGATYTVSFDGKAAPDASGSLVVYDATSGQTIAEKSFSQNAWNNLRLDFTAPAASGHALYIRLTHGASGAAGGEICFDNVKVLPALLRSARGWDKVGLSDAEAYVSSKANEYRSGAYGLAVRNGGKPASYVKQEIMAYAPNRPYEVYYYGKVSAPGAVGKIWVYDETAGTVLAEGTFQNTEWNASYESLRFQTPAAGHVLTLRMTQTGTADLGYAAYFDDVCVGERCLNFVNQAMLIKPILLFVKTVRESPKATVSDKNKAEEYLTFITTKVYPSVEGQYRDIDAARGIYVLADNNASRWMPGKSAPHNQYLRMAENEILLYDITGVESYRTRAEKLLQTFKSALLPSPYSANAYEWKYWNAFGSFDENFWYTSAMEDTSHGNLDVSAAIMGYRHGMVFTLSDMRKFAATFTDVLWNGSYTQPVLGSLVNKQGATTADLLKYTVCTDDWVNLAQFDFRIFTICAAISEKVGKRILPEMNLAALNPENGTNGDFELFDPDDPTLPFRWERENGSAATAYLTKTDVFAGSYALCLEGAGGGVKQQLSGQAISSTYTLKFAAKPGAKVEIYDATAGQALLTIIADQTGFAEYTGTYQTSSEEHALLVRLSLASGEKTVIDGLRIFAEE